MLRKDLGNSLLAVGILDAYTRNNISTTLSVSTTFITMEWGNGYILS